MIDKDYLSSILCTCLSCRDCDTSSIDDFSDLIIENGPEFIAQQRAEMIVGERLLYKNLYRYSAEDIVDSGGHLDRAFLMSQVVVDFGCAKVCAVIDDVTEDTAYIGFVLARRRAREMPREAQPRKSRRRSKPAPLFFRHGNLFEDFGIYVPGWLPAGSSEKAKEHERQRKEKARRNYESRFPPKPEGGE